MLNALLRYMPLPPAMRKRWTFDATEQDFMRYAHAQRQGKPPAAAGGKQVLVQIPNDYYYLCLFFHTTQALGGPVNRLHGLWHQNIMSAPAQESLQGGRRVLRRVFNWLDREKWKLLYAATGVEPVSTLEVSPLEARKNWHQAGAIWTGLQDKQALLALTLHGTHCGDLVYDTYLRYRVRETVDLKDPFLRTVIAQALNAQSAMRSLLARERFDLFLTSYSSYVQHGIPVREALRAGVEVYAAGNLSQYFKQLHRDDPLHAASHWLYGQQFQELADPAAARAEARVQLENRFQGGIDRATLYMKTSAYVEGSSQRPAELDGIEGVVFLHDFFDSPHCYRDMLFPDFWEWACFTLETIQSQGLPIAVKPHPNQLPESREVVEHLKLRFPGVRWIAPATSNRTIFVSGIRCGISVYGTILHELAYHGIAALAGGDHPHVAFDIATTPTSVETYRQQLIDFRSLQLPADVQDQVLAFYYMHNIYDKEDLKVGLEGSAIRSLEQSDSVALKRFMAMEASR